MHDGYAKIIGWGLFAALMFAGPAQAQTARERNEGADRAAQRSERRDGSIFSDRDRMSAWEKGQKELEQQLKTGQEKNFYRQELEKHGFQITSTNYDKPDYTEYEVVKGNNTYEVQIDFDKAGKATKVEVVTNMWQAEGTERALESQRGSGGSRRTGAQSAK
jgi:hypothetical protein